jgi:hypothetical protein
MSYRRHTPKPSVLLWILVALGDVILIVSSVGVLAFIALASVVAVGTAGGWLLIRRSAAANEAVRTVPVMSRHPRRRVSV